MVLSLATTAKAEKTIRLECALDHRTVYSRDGTKNEVIQSETIIYEISQNSVLYTERYFGTKDDGAKYIVIGHDGISWTSYKYLMPPVSQYSEVKISRVTGEFFLEQKSSKDHFTEVIDRGKCKKAAEQPRAID
jgi:hypothetical protein